ncbi:GP160 protein, partial [Polyodon spathula]|nr:GP160 protein [Polyodon spathula]
IMVILKSTGELQSTVHDNTSMFLYLFLFKAGLNCLAMTISHRRMRRSFMGFFGLSLFLADLMFLCFLVAMKFRSSLSDSLCSILSYFSSAYAKLPLPIVILGGIDHFMNLSRSGFPASRSRVFLYCVEVLLVWAIAIFDSMRTMITEIQRLDLPNNQTAFLCPIYSSNTVNLFCVSVLVFTCCLAALCWKQPLLFQRILQATDQDEKSLGEPLRRDLPFSYSKLSDQEEGRESLLNQQQQSHSKSMLLLLSINMDFLVNWDVFMVGSTIIIFCNLAAPSYMSINLLWLSCANSFLIGLVYWIQADRVGPLNGFPDDICKLNFYWLINRQASSLQEKVSHSIYTLSDKMHRNPSLV